MRRLLQPLRFAAILFSMLAFLTTMSLVWLVVRGRWARVRWSTRILRSYARWGLWVLKVKPNFIGLEKIAGLDNGFFVGNHLSYMDVLVILSRLPACFVTSQEIRETPVLGRICQMAGCLFVERRNKFNLLNEVADITEGLRRGFNVAVFPEATSTNGEQILRFRRPLYMAAIQAGRPIVPFCINYRTVGKRTIDRSNRDCICWYGDMDFAPHLWALAGCGGVSVDIIILDPISPASAADPGLLAQTSQAAVEAVFRPVPDTVPTPSV
jgi:1-acyl-sn-glycerol-3-phosphate acyltransferase